MRLPVRQPLFWLLVQLLLTFLVLYWIGGLASARVPDTLSYLNAAEARGLEDILSRHRTFAYPLFLRTVLAFGQWLKPVATVQVVLYFGSIVFLWFGLRRAMGSEWLAYAAVLPLPFAGVMSIATFVQPDFLAAVAAVVAVSFLLLLVSVGSRVAWWIGLGLAVFLAYQLRPAAIFLIGLIPALGVIWMWLRGERRRLGRWLAVAVATTAMPFLLFCGLRWATVGHFGLVSFGGMNLAGLAANFLDGRLIRELPEEQRSVAKSMFQLRRKRGWKPMNAESVVLEHFKQYSDNIWDVAIPAARKEYRRLLQLPEGDPARPAGIERPQQIVNNDILSAVSKTIVRLRPALYLRWFRHAVVYGLNQLLSSFWIMAPALVIVFSLPLYVLRSVGRESPATTPAVQAALTGLVLLGLGYFAAYLLLVCLVSFPFARYFVSMTLFLPSMMTALLFVIYRRILGLG